MSHQIHGKSGKEFRSITTVTLAFLEKEAPAQLALIRK